MGLRDLAQLFRKRSRVESDVATATAKASSQKPTVAAPPAKAAPSGADKRAYDRYRSRDRDAIVVDFGDGTRAEIRDVSYGGFAARMVAPSSAARAEDGCKIRLEAWGEAVTGRASLVYVADGISAFVLHHETPDVLLFLRNFIERLRQGRSLTLIEHSNMNAPFNDARWLCMRGDGPTEVRVCLDERQRLVEGIITSTDRGGDMEVTFRHGRVAFTGSSQGRAIGSFPERNAIRTAAALLAGADIEGANPALDAFYRLLKAELSVPMARLVRAG